MKLVDFLVTPIEVDILGLVLLLIIFILVGVIGMKKKQNN